MKIAKVIILFILMANFLIGSEITKTNHEFISLCTEDDSTGFKWKNKKWRQVNFTTSKYLVKRVKNSAEYCDVKDNRKVFDKNKMNFTNGCYLLKEHGSKDGWGALGMDMPEECNEVWKYEKNKFKLTRVNCRNISFQPNGNFMRESLGVNLDDNPKNDYKDSVSLSHGKCSTLD